MWPTIISIGQFHLSAFGVSLALAFIVGAFNVWREARNRGKKIRSQFGANKDQWVNPNTNLAPIKPAIVTTTKLSKILSSTKPRLRASRQTLKAPTIKARARLTPNADRWNCPMDIIVGHIIYSFL